jgi:hypothetical protein
MSDIQSFGNAVQLAGRFEPWEAEALEPVSRFSLGDTGCARSR